MSTKIPILDIPKYHADEMLGRVHSFESFGTVDGPGTRFVVFLQGCLFRCKYCHNRDTWDLDGGQLYSVTEVVEQILPYAKFMDASGGGVTVTGGEPVLQPHFVGLLFQKLRENGIHTCLDTNGYVGVYSDEVNHMIEQSDLVMCDIKHINDHKTALREMRSMVDSAVKLLKGNGALEEFGEMLHEAWMIKRSLSDRITNTAIDSIYSAARSAGAIGGKLLGAGGGGFMLLFVTPERHYLVRERLEKLFKVPFRFENGGSQIIFRNSVL